MCVLCSLPSLTSCYCDLSVSLWCLLCVVPCGCDGWSLLLCVVVCWCVLCVCVVVFVSFLLFGVVIGIVSLRVACSWLMLVAVIVVGWCYCWLMLFVRRCVFIGFLRVLVVVV